MPGTNSHPSAALASAVEQFRAAWGATANAAAMRCVAPSNGVPHDFLPWYCGVRPLGYLSAERAQLLTHHLNHTRLQPTRLDWDAGDWSVDARSAELQRVLLTLRETGHLPGWRDEIFSFPAVDSREPFLHAERAGFYFLGMRSEAVHVNGVTLDGRMWIARRSAGKAIDPGLLDNLCAGGLAAHENAMQAVKRELYEEAGLHVREHHSLCCAGSVSVGRVRDGGWHQERLQIYNLLIANDEQPVNQDGEVQEFQLMEAREIARLIVDGQFTPDASAAIGQGLLTPG